MEAPINTRFDLYPRLHSALGSREPPKSLDPNIPMCGIQLRRAMLWQVPNENQIISIGGNPYRVLNVGWALPDDDDNDAGQLYAYVDVEKAKQFTISMVVNDEPTEL